MLSTSEFEDVACPLCGKNESQLHMFGNDLLGMVEGKCSLRRCDGCGLVYLSPRPKPRDIVNLYPESYEPHHVSRFSCVRRLKRIRQFFRARRLRRYFPESGHLLEVGCGSGDLLIEFERLGYAVSGLDFSKTAVETARRAHGLEIACSSVEEADFNKGSFDIILMHHVIEHFFDPLATLAQLRGWLKPDGVLVLGTPDVSAGSAIFLKEGWIGYSFPIHMVVFDGKTLKEMAIKAGFSRVDILHELDGNDWIGGLKRWCPMRRHRWWKLFWSIENPVAQVMVSPIALMTYLMRRSGRMIAVIR